MADKMVRARSYGVLTHGGWTVGRFFDRDAAAQVAAQFRLLAARRVYGSADDVVVKPSLTAEYLTPQEYATRVASGAKFEVVD